MIRITTNGVLQGYKSSLMRSSNNLSAARDKVLSRRNYASYAEDPASATQAFKLRRAFSRTSGQLSSATSLSSKFQSAWSAVASIKTDLVEKMGKVASVEGNTDSAGSSRQPLGEVLSSAAKSIVQTMNNKFGDNFVFAGNDGLNVPFTWGANGELLYRGIDVNAGNVADLPKGNPPDPSQVQAGSDWGNYYAANPDFAKLAKMTYENAYIDVGAGLAEDSSGNIISSSAFDSAISGIDILGYGVDADGDPKNVVSLMNKLSKIYSNCDSESGEFNPPEDKAVAQRLGDKINDALSSLTNKLTELDGQAKYLDATKTRLKDSAVEINEQFLTIEQCDLADAITEFSWAQYCYNSALKVGNSILSQSLIDYMN